MLPLKIIGVTDRVGVRDRRVVGSHSKDPSDCDRTSIKPGNSRSDILLTIPLLPDPMCRDDTEADRDAFPRKSSAVRPEFSPLCQTDTAASEQDQKKVGNNTGDNDENSDSSEIRGGYGVLPEISFVTGVMGGVNNGLDEKVGTLLRHGSMVATAMWLIFLVAATLSPAESFERLEGFERNANITVLILLLYTNMSKMLRMVVRDKSFIFVNTGIMAGAVTVQIIAMLSITLMICFPTPVVIDPVTGIRSHLVRWAEWTSLAFLMTFLTESIDLPLNRKPTIAWVHGIAIGMSTSAGALTAFCTTWTAWMVVFNISWILFSSLYIRLYQRYNRLVGMSTGVTVEEKEDYDRAKYSLKTIAVCTLAWTCLAVSWSVVAFMKSIAAPDSFFARKDLVLVTESFFEALSKIWYADLLVEIHNVVFDDASRTMRRLEELRAFMSAVWDHSSDVLIWGSQRGDIINGIVSPSFFSNDHAFGVLAESVATSQGGRLRNAPDSTLLIEVHPATREYRSFAVDLRNITREEATAVLAAASCNQRKTINTLSRDSDKNLSVIADLLCHSYHLEDRREKTTIREFYSNASKDQIRQCEAKITNLASASCLIVLRDISERFQRFETEKRLIEEQTARRKDSEANRFTRHEVKNGILAAIGLVESIRDSKSTSFNASREDSSDSSRLSSQSCLDYVAGDESFVNPIDSESLFNVSPSGQPQISDTAPERRLSTGSNEDTTSSFSDAFGELDSTLRDVLDAIMDHAMSLDVINEEYDVRKERVSVPEVISNLRRQANGISTNPRFTLKSLPDPFPIIGLDPRLLRHVYQNALSNACRYGKPGGKVETIIEYNDTINEFKLSVVNEPGLGHERLLVMSPEEVKRRVFSKGLRLHVNSLSDVNDGPVVTNSSGDGGWICQKIATIVDGNVDLKFEKDHTVFSFRFPSRKLPSDRHNLNGRIPDLKQLPCNTWGIAVDDSGIQRKLMDRFLKIAGIETNKRIIIGQTSEEIYTISETVIAILKKNPEDKVLLIVDENLEVVDGQAVHETVSGSLCIQNIIEKLEPSEECRLLALVRSANDSSRELAIYESRSHGYLLKAPIDQRGVMGVIGPIWSKRFKPGDGTPVLERSNSDGSSTFGSNGYDPYHDIMQVVEVIDALCKVGNTNSLKKRWKSIQEKLQTLKGDLKSTIFSKGPVDSLAYVLGELESLRLGSFPADLRERWIRLESQIKAVINTNR